MIDALRKNNSNYSFPNYCFTKQFKKYFFLISNILSTGKDNRDRFFEILQLLQNDIIQIENDWCLFVPGLTTIETSDGKGQSQTVIFNEQIYKKNILRIQSYIESTLPAEFWMPFIGVFRKFWIFLGDEIQVYIDHDYDIIVIGVDNLRQNYTDKTVEHLLTKTGYKNGFTEYLDNHSDDLIGLTADDKIRLSTAFDVENK